MTREQLESRQLELLAIMRKSDEHASKCYKLGRKYSTQYPEEYAEYLQANEEYNANEALLAGMSDEPSRPEDEF